MLTEVLAPSTEGQACAPPIASIAISIGATAVAVATSVKRPAKDACDWTAFDRRNTARRSFDNHDIINAKAGIDANQTGASGRLGENLNPSNLASTRQAMQAVIEAPAPTAVT